MVDDTVWKRRFQIFMVARLFGLLMVFAGIAIGFTDLVREGGWPVVGAIIAMLGAIDAVFAPKLLKKQWERDDELAGK